MSRKSSYSKNDQHIMSELRRLSYRWEPRKHCITAARRAPNQYECAHCKGLHTWQEMKADHIEPVINPEVGFVDIPTFCARLFVDEDGYQALCDPCHKLKTKEENARRTEKGTWKWLKA